MKCTISKCTREARFKKPKVVCSMHYKRWKAHGNFDRRLVKPSLTKYGYLRVTTLDGKRMQEHRYIMEQHLGRKLSPDETVHHINHIRTDNRIENLMVISRSEHTKMFHNGVKKRLADWSKYTLPSPTNRWHKNPSKKCLIENCKNSPKIRGLCQRHYFSYNYYINHNT